MDEVSNRQLRGLRAPTLIEKLAKAALVQQEPEDWLRKILTLKNLNGGTAYAVAELLRRSEVAKGTATNSAGNDFAGRSVTRKVSTRPCARSRNQERDPEWITKRLGLREGEG